jgi:parallel beta-helix repeat protein
MGWKGISVVVILLLVGSSTSLSMIVIGFATSPGQTLSETIFVDDNNTAGPWDGTLDHPYQHIQDGVNNASEENTVFVFSGYYYEQVSIRKTLNLIGENQNTTTISYWGNAASNNIVLIAAANIHVSHFTVVLSNGTCTAIQLNHANYSNVSFITIHSSWAIDIYKSNYNSIFNNDISTINGGITLSNDQNQFNVIKGNHLTNAGNPDLIYNFGVVLGEGPRNNQIIGNYFTDCQDNAILSLSSYDNIIEKNLIIGNRSKVQSGMDFNWMETYPTAGNIVRDNVIKNCSSGGIATSTDYQTITDNIIEYCGYGMSINSNYVTIKNNTIRDCKVGQDIWFSQFPTILADNLYENCHEGIEVWDCRSVTFTRNTFRNTTYAISVYESFGNNFYRNNFENNKRDVIQADAHNHWLQNYWGGPRLLPKPIFGILSFIQFDWLPAQQPN